MTTLPTRREAARLGIDYGAGIALLISVLYLFSSSVGIAVAEWKPGVGIDDVASSAVFVFLFGLLFGCVPAVVLGTISGVVVGLILRQRSERAGTGEAALVGAGVAGLAVLVFDLLVFRAEGTLPLDFVLVVIGLPSIIFVVGFAWIGVRVRQRILDW